MNKFLVGFIAASIMSTAGATTISSDKDLTPENIKIIFGSKAVMQGLYSVGTFYEQLLDKTKGCKENIQIKPKAIGLLSPIKYEVEQEYPTEGTWSMRFVLKHCGQDSTYNALFMANKEGTPSVKPFYPGESHADFMLMKDVLNSAMPLVKALTVKDKECDKLYLSDTKVSNPIKDGAWSETWTFKSCKSYQTIDIEFKPDAKGTKFNIKTKP